MKNPIDTDTVLALAKQAGFCFWGKEAHRPAGATVDWSCVYDKELANFAQLVSQHTESQLQQKKKSPEPVWTAVNLLLLTVFLIVVAFVSDYRRNAAEQAAEQMASATAQYEQLTSACDSGQPFFTTENGTTVVYACNKLKVPE